MYYPRDGEILQCDFRGFIAPEMIKTRPVVIIGPRLRHRGDLATIVPLSTSIVDRPTKWQVRVKFQTRLPAPFDSEYAWAKCDLVCSISTARLDRFRPPRQRYGGRNKWMSSKISKEDLLRVRQGVLYLSLIHI